MALIENLHGFRYISIIALVSIIYVASIVLIQLPSFVNKNYSPERLVYANWNITSIL
jgi:hypothetical protein